MAEPPTPERKRSREELIRSAAAAGVSTPAQVQLSAEVAVQEHYSGPIPPPEILQKYNQVHPGLAEQIIAMAQSEAAHRRKMEEEVLAIQKHDQISYRRSELIGQGLGAIIALAGIGGSVYEAVNGAWVAASVLAPTALLSIVVAFILGRQALLKLKEQELRHAQVGQSRTPGERP
jgi:uncharacterized membrane protein